MTQEELDEVIRKHKLWLNGEEGGERANLIDKDLRGLDMDGADMRDARMEHVDMRYASMRNADMRNAHMRDANMEYIYMRSANMENADMVNVNMRFAIMMGANMEDANMEYADIRNAIMDGTNMKGANIDYSCLPLWCGSLYADFDDKQLRQIAYHLVKAGITSKNASEETKNELAKLIEFANGFHRAKGCGLITAPSQKECGKE